MTETFHFFSSIALTADYVHVIGSLADRHNEFVLTDLYAEES